MKITVYIILVLELISVACFGQTKEDSCYACGTFTFFCEDIIENNDCDKKWQYLNQYYRLNNLNKKSILVDTSDTITSSKMIIFDLHDTIVKILQYENVSYQILKEIHKYNKIKYAEIHISTNWENELIADDLFKELTKKIAPINTLEYLCLFTRGNIDSSIFKLKKLKKLELQFVTQSADKKTLDFPQKLNNEMELQSLEIGLNNHSGVSENIYSLNKLENLVLNFNEYAQKVTDVTLPNGISNLSKLISLKFTKITKLPDDIGGLFNLEKIELTGNIKTIPETWNKMKLLESIDVAGCINIDSLGYQQIFRTPNLRKLKINVKGLKYLSKPVDNCRFNVIYLGGNSINLNELENIKSLTNISIDSNYTLKDISIINKLKIKKIKIHDVPLDSALYNLKNFNYSVNELLIDNISFLLLNKKSIKKLKALKKIIVYDATDNYKNGSQKTRERLNWNEADIMVKKKKLKYISSYRYLRLKAIKSIKKCNKNIEITFTSRNI